MNKKIFDIKILYINKYIKITKNNKNMNYNIIDKKVDFLREIEKFKIIDRKIRKINLQPETNSDHTWHLAMYILVFKDELKKENLNYEKLLELALIHDLPEIYSGDAFPFNEEEKKIQKEIEFKAAEKLFSILDEKTSKKFTELFNEYENKKTKEACIVNAIDKIQPDNLNISTKGQNWKEMKITRKMLINYKQKLCETSQLTKYLFEKNIKEGDENNWMLK